MAMTDKEYRKKLDQLIRAYLKMRTIATEMREADYMYPIAVNMSSYCDPYVQLAKTAGWMKAGGLKYEADPPVPENENFQSCSAERQGIRLFYLK